MRGKFITIEGGEGVGKTTFLKGLTAALDKMGINFIQTFEPGGTPTANQIRALFLTPPQHDPLHINAEFCLVSAARAQHVGTLILPALNAGTWVLCDRFADSSRVYQGGLGGIPKEDLEYIIRFTSFAIQPDVTFLLDCPIEVSWQRIRTRKQDSQQEMSRFDAGKKSMHERIRQCFLDVQKSDPQRVVLLDACQETQNLVVQALGCLKERFSL